MSSGVPEFMAKKRSRGHPNLTPFNPILVWVCQFKWAAEKYPSRMSLPELVKVINTSLTEIDQVLKKKSSSYNAMRSKLAQFEKKSTSSLVTRPLNDIIKVLTFTFMIFADKIIILAI